MSPAGSRVELYSAIRRDARAGLSNRALQRKHRVGYRTVAAALASAWPKARKPPPKRGSRLDPYVEVIDDWLRDDLDAPRKQRHTAKRIFDRLLDEHDAVGVVSYWMVREYVATRRREIRVEAGREPANAFIPQEHLPGREAEVDFGEVAIRLRGELVTCALFSLRLSYSDKAVHRINASAGQEAFFEGHAYAFDVLGGVPTGKIRYDNLKAAVASVIGFSRQRVEADRWTAFRSHYGIEAFYCQPGIQGAHEKGGVEGQIGWFRRNHLVPVPEVESFAELNAMVDAWDQADDARRIGSRARTVGEHFATEQPLLAPWWCGSSASSSTSITSWPVSPIHPTVAVRGRAVADTSTRAGPELGAVNPTGPGDQRALSAMSQIVMALRTVIAERATSPIRRRRQ